MKWKTYCLGDLYEVHNGLAKGREFFGQGYPFLSFSTVFNNYFIPEQIVDLVQSTDKEQENYSILRGDVFVTRTSETSDELGISCVALKDYPFATYNGFCKRMRPITEVVLPEFIGYYMRMPSFRNEFLAFSTMTTRASLRNEDLLGIKITVPSLNNQKKIANILLSYDKLIRNNQKQIKLLEEAAQRLYKEWFVDLRFPGHEDVEIVDGLPEGWKKVSMDSIAEYLNGYAFKPNDWNTTGKPIIKIKEMTEGISNNTPRNNGVDIPEKYNVRKGDILFSWSATLTTMVWDDEDGLLNQHLFKVTPRKDISREFMLQSILLTLEDFKNLTTGSTMKHIQRGKLKEVYINMPTVSVMDQFAMSAEPFREAILELKRKILLLQEARERLLPKLMSGEVEV